MKRISMMIQSKKYPGQTFVGYALLHEFNPKRLSFFTAQKFPVDDVLEVDVDFFGSKAHLRVQMVNIHEQISSGRVMNAIPNEENPFPVRKFYRCYAIVGSLQGQLPNLLSAMNDAPGAAAQSAPDASAGAAGTETPNAGDAVVPAAAAGDEPPVANAGDSLVSPSDRPADAEEVRAKLAALSGGDAPAPEAAASAAEVPAAEEKQAA